MKTEVIKPAGDISVFDFNETDPKPLKGKNGKKSFFLASFVGKGRVKNARRKKYRSVSVMTGKKCCNNKKRLGKRGSPVQDQAAQVAVSSEFSLDSDEIETDESGSILNEDASKQPQVDTEVGNAGRAAANTCTNEVIDVKAMASVAIIGNLQIFSKICGNHTCVSEFTFTADSIHLAIKDFPDLTMSLQLDELEGFGFSDHQQEGSVLLFLLLSESGAHALKSRLSDAKLSEYDIVDLDSVLKVEVSDVNWREHQKHITSLSDRYKSLWRPPTMHDNFNLVDNESKCRHDSKILTEWVDIVYPEGDNDAVTVTAHDYLLLRPHEFVSDTIIDFYIKYLQSNLSELCKRKLYFFNSFFFRKLTEPDKTIVFGMPKYKMAFERVKRWTAKVNIFEKDYLFIPIMQSAHWSLIIICHPGFLPSSYGCHDVRAPVIFHLDSLEGCHTDIEEPVKNYLIEAWMQKHAQSDFDCTNKPTVQFIPARVPQQTNYSDCGLFLLHYVELLIKEVLNGGSIVERLSRDVDSASAFDSVVSQWFDPAEASEKRMQIKGLLESHHRQLIERVKLQEVEKHEKVLSPVQIVSTDGLRSGLSSVLGDDSQIESRVCLNQENWREHLQDLNHIRCANTCVKGDLRYIPNAVNTSFEDTMNVDPVFKLENTSGEGLAEEFHAKAWSGERSNLAHVKKHFESREENIEAAYCTGARYSDFESKSEKGWHQAGSPTMFNCSLSKEESGETPYANCDAESVVMDSEESESLRYQDDSSAGNIITSNLGDAIASDPEDWHEHGQKQKAHRASEGLQEMSPQMSPLQVEDSPVSPDLHNISSDEEPCKRNDLPAVMVMEASKERRQSRSTNVFRNAARRPVTRSASRRFGGDPNNESGLENRKKRFPTVDYILS